MLKNFFKANENIKINECKKEKKLFLIACILIEIAKSDDNFDDNELSNIKDILKRNNHAITTTEIDDIFNDALKETNNSVEMYSLTKEIRDMFEHNQILELFQYMWEIILTDGEIDDFESGLIRKACGLFHVTGKESSLAKENAMLALSKK